MKILILTPWFPSFPTDQSGNFIFDSISSLRKKNITLSVYLIKPWIPGFIKVLHRDWGRAQFNSELFDFDYPLIQMKYVSLPRNYLKEISYFFMDLVLVPRLLIYIKENNITLIHAHTELMAFLAEKLSRKSGIPYIVSLHGVNNASSSNTKSYLTLIGKALTNASRVILVGKPIKPYFSMLVSDDTHFRVVPNGFRLSTGMKSKTQYHWGEGVKFVSVSNLHKGKGIDINLRALALLKKSGYSNWHYTIIGNGREKENLKTLAIRLKIYEKITFLGELPHNKVYIELEKSDVFILPSYQEAFGIVYLEAMAHGLLTIAVIGQGASTFIDHEYTGLLVKPKSTTSLLDVLRQVFTVPREMVDIAKRGHFSATTYYTWTKHADKLIDVYKEVEIE